MTSTTPKVWVLQATQDEDRQDFCDSVYVFDSEEAAWSAFLKYATDMNEQLIEEDEPAENIPTLDELKSEQGEFYGAKWYLWCPIINEGPMC